MLFIYQISFKCIDFLHKKKPPAYQFDIFYFSILFYPITLECHRGTTDEFATIPFHLVLFSAALVELAKSISVHSLYCLPTSSSVCLFFFLFPFTVFHSIVFAITCIQMEKGINVQHNTKIHHCIFSLKKKKTYIILTKRLSCNKANYKTYITVHSLCDSQPKDKYIKGLVEDCHYHSLLL